MRLVVKFAGALLEEKATVAALAHQIAALAKQGHEILVVHGGGRIFTGMLQRLGIESKSDCYETRRQICGRITRRKSNGGSAGPSDRSACQTRPRNSRSSRRWAHLHRHAAAAGH